MPVKLTSAPKNTFLPRKGGLPCVADNFENVNDESRKSCPVKQCIRSP